MFELLQLHIWWVHCVSVIIIVPIVSLRLCDIVPLRLCDIVSLWHGVILFMFTQQISLLYFFIFVTLIFVMKLTNTNTKSGKKSQSFPPFSICFWQKKFTSASTKIFGHLPLFVESTFSAPGQTRAVSVSIRTGKACHCIVVFGIAWYDSAIWFLNTDSGYKGYTFRIKWVHLIDIEAKNFC